MTNKQALRTDQLIANALETAKQLRELQESPVADAIFESIVENENGKEIQFERPISDLAYAAFLQIERLVEVLEAAEKRIAELEARGGAPLMFIDGDISPDDAEKLAAIIRDFNEETETPAARMARIIRENPHPTNMCDMPSTDRINGED